MKTLAVHIGAHKTASSLLKTMLNSMGGPLAQAGAIYDGQWQLGEELNLNSPLKKTRQDELRVFYEQRYGATAADLVIISSEEFSGHASRCYENAGAIAHDLKHIFSGFKVIISAAVRRQDTFFESVYGQTVKIYNKSSFEDWKAEQDIWQMRWDKFLGEFAGVFGKENTRVIPYELLLNDAGMFISEFLLSLSLHGTVSVDKLPVVNPGLSKKGIELFRRCNEIAETLDEHERKLIRKFLEENFPKNPADRNGFFTEEERTCLLEHYRQSNLNLFASYLKKFNPAYYLGKAEHIGYQVG